MVSQSKSSINAAAICLTAMLMAASTTHAQLSSVPKRYRSTDAKQPQQQRRSLEVDADNFGRHHHQRQQQDGQQKKKTNNLRRKDGARQLSSMPIEQSEFSLPIRMRVDAPDPILSMPPIEQSALPDMSLPSIELAEMMSMPLIDSEFSLPMEIDTHGDELDADPEKSSTVSLENGDGSNGSTLILASFLAGISALVVGAMALFVKMRRVHGRQIVEQESQSQEERDRGEGNFRVVSFASQDEYDDDLNDELNDFEGANHEIVIS